MADRLRRRKLKLWNQNPHCFFCGVLTELAPANDSFFKKKDNTTTIEHLNTRYNPKRWLPGNNKERTVLACNKCNLERGRQEELQVPIEERRKRSKRFPKNYSMIYNNV